jgi:diaminopimelate decarboxylase
MIEFAQHAPSPYFDSVDGELVIGGHKVSALVAAAGRTPFYCYDGRIMERKVSEFRAAMPPEIELHYAIKANPLPAVVARLASLTNGLDVASGRELDIALATRTAREDISFAGPGKSPAELEQAVAAGIIVNAESELELERLTAIAHRAAMRPRVAIRVNPDFELKSSGMKMGGGPKQFGIDAERVPAVLQTFVDSPLEFWGFHIFSGSQNLRAESLIESQAKSAQLACELARAAPAPVRLLNLGGGFGIPYFPGEKPLQLEPVAMALRALVPSVRRALPQAKLVIELGRFLVGESGVYICRIVDRKLSRGHVFLITDGGLHHHLSASGNFGQVLRKNYPVLIANRIGAGQREVASVVGPLCTPLDLLADRMELATAQVGDLVAVFQSGAYGASASPQNFLSHPPVGEIFL